MVKYFLLLLILFFTSCELIKQKKLSDGTTKVPFDENYFNKNYRDKYQIIFPNGIDGNSIYIESFYLSRKGEIFNSKKGHNSFIEGIRFYKNGCVSSFTIDKNSLIDSLNLDPSSTGYRGICYVNKKDTLIDIIVPISDAYDLGKANYNFKIKGDTLFLKYKRDPQIVKIYLKTTLKKESINYNSVW